MCIMNIRSSEWHNRKVFTISSGDHEFKQCELVQEQLLYQVNYFFKNRQTLYMKSLYDNVASHTFSTRSYITEADLNLMIYFNIEMLFNKPVTNEVFLSLHAIWEMHFPHANMAICFMNHFFSSSLRMFAFPARLKAMA